jgi:uncharacterized tellurite resistance protein B-like protein
MIRKLQQFFNAHIDPTRVPPAVNAEQRTRVAVAALLVEIAVSDFESVSDERQTIVEIVTKGFGLSKQEADTLLALAQEEHRSSTDYFQFTRLINTHYTPRQKAALVESLWRVAFADGQLHKYEEHVIRRLADLLHVAHRDFIAAKHRAMADKGRD